MANKVAILIFPLESLFTPWFAGAPFPVVQTPRIDDDELDAESLSEHDDRLDPGISSPRPGR